MPKKVAQPPEAQPDVSHLSQLVADPANRRQHTPRNIGMVVDALHEVGAARSIVIDEHNMILAGNGVADAAAEAGLTKVRVVEADGQEIIAVRRRGLTDAQKRALAIYDNRTAELATWNYPQLEADLAAGASLQPFWSPEEEAALLSRAAADDLMQRGSAPSSDEHTPASATGYQTFSCPLTVDQERVVRAALRVARTRYQVTTTGDALTAMVTAWSDAILTTANDVAHD
jgi:hypothetical protein